MLARQRLRELGKQARQRHEVLRLVEASGSSTVKAAALAARIASTSVSLRFRV